MKDGIYIIDRIEEGIIVLVPDEGGLAVNLPADALPDAAEGSAVEIADGGERVRLLTSAERPPEKERNRARLHTLFAKGKSTD